MERGIKGSARVFLFFSFVESPNSLQGKKVQKKGGHVQGKTRGGFSFFPLPPFFFAFAPHMFESFGIWLPEEACQPIKEMGGGA